MCVHVCVLYRHHVRSLTRQSSFILIFALKFETPADMLKCDYFLSANDTGLAEDGWRTNPSLSNTLSDHNSIARRTHINKSPQSLGCKQRSKIETLKNENLFVLRHRSSCYFINCWLDHHKTMNSNNVLDLYLTFVFEAIFKIQIASMSAVSGGFRAICDTAHLSNKRIFLQGLGKYEPLNGKATFEKVRIFFE